MKAKVLTGEQIGAARALLRWDQATLAGNAGVSIETVQQFEGIAGPISANRVAVQAICQSLEMAGIEFLDRNGGGPGVRTRK